MNDSKQGDEMNDNRLSSFLVKNGNIKPVHLTCIQKHVFYVETDQREQIILKRHHTKSRIVQQWQFFEQQSSSVPVAFKRFPNHRKFLYNNGKYWTITPYISGRQLSYKIAQDRKDALDVLRKFHVETKGVKIYQPLKRQLFYVRWHDRLQHFKITEPIFREHGFHKLFTDIVKTTEKYLEAVSRYDWGAGDDRASHTGTWAHGDVAAHNFIRFSGRIYLIDFDLLSCTSPLHDYIQLAQRFLPNINWDPERLLSYKFVHEGALKAWLYAVFVPSDVMREWLYYLKRDSPRPLHIYLEKMEEDWLKRQSFLKIARKMLN